MPSLKFPRTPGSSRSRKKTRPENKKRPAADSAGAPGLLRSTSPEVAAGSWRRRPAASEGTPGLRSVTSGAAGSWRRGKRHLSGAFQAHWSPCSHHTGGRAIASPITLDPGRPAARLLHPSALLPPRPPRPISLLPPAPGTPPLLTLTRKLASSTHVPCCSQAVSHSVESTHAPSNSANR